MSYLHCGRSRLRDRVYEESCRNVCGHPQLPGFEHNVPLGTVPRILQLSPIRLQVNQMFGFASYIEQFFNEEVLDRRADPPTWFCAALTRGRSLSIPHGVAQYSSQMQQETQITTHNKPSEDSCRS